MQRNKSIHERSRLIIYINLVLRGKSDFRLG